MENLSATVNGSKPVDGSRTSAQSKGHAFVLEKILPVDVKRTTWVAFFAWIFAVYDFILFGTLLPEIGKSYGWDDAMQAFVATWVAVGTAVIAFAIGPMLDKLGRRTGLVWTVAGAAICSGLTAVGGAFGKVPLILIRSLSGLGYAEETVNATYLNEMYAAANDPKLNKNKGFIYSLVQGGWPVGALVAAGLTAVLLPLIGWRGCFVFATFPALIIIFMTRRLKESPAFLVHQEITRLNTAGQVQQARALATEHHVDYEEHKNAGLSAAFKGKALRATLVLGGGIFLNWCAIQVFSVLGTTVLTSVHNVSFENSLIILVLSNVVGYCGYLAHGYIGDRIGRRNTLAIGWTLGGIAFCAMLYGPSDVVTVVALYSVGLFFLNGPYSAALFFIGESYPTAIRGTGSSIVHAMGPIGAIMAGIGVTYLLSNGSNWQQAGFYFDAVPCFLSGLVIFMAKHVNPEVPN